MGQFLLAKVGQFLIARIRSRPTGIRIGVITWCCSPLEGGVAGQLFLIPSAIVLLIYFWRQRSRYVYARAALEHGRAA